MTTYAMTGPDTRTTQLYINLDDNTQLDDQGFAPIGRIVEGTDVVEQLYAEYDESAGGGMRGGNQGKIIAEGNAHLDAEFPNLDSLNRALIISELLPQPGSEVAISMSSRHSVLSRIGCGRPTPQQAHDGLTTTEGHSGLVDQLVAHRFQRTTYVLPNW